MITDQVHEFARGASFEVILSLPANIEENYFADWDVTSQLRKAGDITDESLISNLTFEWIDGRKFMLIQDETNEWPIGKAELDVLFSNGSGRKIRTKKLSISITHGVTAG